MRYYLYHSAAFGLPPFVYHLKIYKAVVKAFGGRYVRESKQHGWSNQPKVVTWEGNSEVNEAIREALSQVAPFHHGGGLPCPIIHKQDW